MINKTNQVVEKRKKKVMYMTTQDKYMKMTTFREKNPSGKRQGDILEKIIV